MFLILSKFTMKFKNMFFHRRLNAFKNFNNS